MTRTEDRLTGALTAAARAVPEQTLRPLTAPPSRRRRPTWVTPLAAALGVVLVIGLVIAAGTWLAGSGSSSGPAGGMTPVPRYYVVEDLQSSVPLVRSTATGKITDTVPVALAAKWGVRGLVASTPGGEYFVVATARGTRGERLYRFRLTSTGRVTGFAAVPGGTVGAGHWAADAMAASPDGSRVAISLTFNWSGQSCSIGPSCQEPPRPDYIEVIDVRTGVRSVWRPRAGSRFTVASLSWTAYGRELVYLGQTCGRVVMNSEICEDTRMAEIRALNPATGGGRLDSSRVLLRQSALYPYIAQAQISPDGATVTAIVLTGHRTAASHGVRDLIPPHLSVIQVSLASGRVLRVLYRRNLQHTYSINTGPDVLQLSQDSAGQHWMLSGGLCGGRRCGGEFNGWLRDGRLVPLPPVNGADVGEAW